MNPETKIEMQACELIYKHLGIKSCKLTTPGQTGYPDRIFWVPFGEPLLVEFKQPGEIPRAKQIGIRNELAAHGYCVTCFDDSLELFSYVIDLCENLAHKYVGAERSTAKRVIANARKAHAAMLEDAT